MITAVDRYWLELLADRGPIRVVREHRLQRSSLYLAFVHSCGLIARAKYRQRLCA